MMALVVKISSVLSQGWISAPVGLVKVCVAVEFTGERQELTVGLEGSSASHWILYF